MCLWSLLLEFNACVHDCVVVFKHESRVDLRVDGPECVQTGVELCRRDESVHGGHGSPGVTAVALPHPLVQIVIHRVLVAPLPRPCLSFGSKYA